MGTCMILGNRSLNNASPERLADYTPASINESRARVHFIPSTLELPRVLTLFIMIELAYE